MRMAVAGHQLPRALALALGMPAAHEAAVVQEEPQQVQVRAAEVPAQGEVGAQPRVEVLHQRAAARGVRHGPAHGREQDVELAPRLRSQSVPPLPIRGRGAGQAVQHAGFPHEGLGDGVGACDAGQLGVEHTGEGEQVVALVLQRHAHRADASWVLELAGCEFHDDEVEQLSPGSAIPSFLSNAWVAAVGLDCVAAPAHDGLERGYGRGGAFGRAAWDRARVHRRAVWA